MINSDSPIFHEALDRAGRDGEPVEAVLIEMLADDLRKASDLLYDARPATHDPGLRRSWSQRRRHLRDRINDL